MDELKRKFLCAVTRKEKIQILTLVPNNWLQSKAASFSNTSEYLVKLARETKHENGIKGMPMPIHRQELVIEIIEKVINFYESDEISSFCPGRKEHVT